MMLCLMLWVLTVVVLELSVGCRSNEAAPRKEQQADEEDSRRQSHNPVQSRNGVTAKEPQLDADPGVWHVWGRSMHVAQSSCTLS